MASRMQPAGGASRAAQLEGVAVRAPRPTYEERAARAAQLTQARYAELLAKRSSAAYAARASRLTEQQLRSVLDQQERLKATTRWDALLPAVQDDLDLMAATAQAELDKRTAVAETGAGSL